MAGKTIIMSKLKQIMLRNEGTPLQTIAKAISIARNTVKKYLRLIEIKGLDAAVLLKMEDTALEALLEDPDPEDQERLANLEELFPYFEQELSRTGVTRWILWGEYKQQYPSGFSYSRFCAHFSQWKRSRSATLFFEHQPADKLFIDFTGKKTNNS